MPKSISQVLIVGVLAFVLLNVVLAADSTLANSEANASESFTPPKPIKRVIPDFSRPGHGHFTAVVVAKIGKNGKVISAELQSASDPEFGAAALAAARKWRWEPAKEDGRPVEVKLTMPFEFDK